MVFPVSKHTSICGSLSEHLNRESSNILILAPTCLHPDHTNTVTTQAREGQHRGQSISAFSFYLTFLSSNSPFSTLPQCPLYVSLNRRQMTVFSCVFEPDCNTVLIHRPIYCIYRTRRESNPCPCQDHWSFSGPCHHTLSGY